VDVLVVDIGGTRVKLRASTSPETRRFRSAPDLGPAALVEQVLAHVDWHYDAVAIGFPGPVDANGPSGEPGNLGTGWIGFQFERAFGKPVRVVNDALLQALGAYDSGRMLFLGLGTGVGSALVTEHVLVPLELGSLPHPRGDTLFQQLGRDGLKRLGLQAWQQAIVEVVPMLREAFLADYVVLGGGNAKKVDPLPENTRRGGNEDAFTGGLRLWEETIEPHDRVPARVWRVVR
jgi:polyphosphate glucokinase